MAGLTPAERKALMDEMKNEKVAPPRGETKKTAEIFKEGMKTPQDDEGPVQPMQPVKKAKGGTASSRADGIAQRGKTRGKMY
jgi:hypothetical protein